MNILPAHPAALCQFGYSDQEVTFIYLVATHSGAGSRTLGAWASEFNTIASIELGRMSASKSRGVTPYESAGEYAHNTAWRAVDIERKVVQCDQTSVFASSIMFVVRSKRTVMQ